ncbi:unnamed protein product [Rhizophagus irregularis]|uniref:Uncharacterized protein n=1 Tax=Rhizophagus irregularis TaxID=588596 RepID=A0A915ZTD2_9GLOM|nr:unnamed protein product [Rhizophagus irregularis]CAB5389555.1 unnamed protein product [Rhizophagus irregularis]
MSNITNRPVLFLYCYFRFSLEASEWQKYVLTFQILNFVKIQKFSLFLDTFRTRILMHYICWDATRKLKVFLIWNMACFLYADFENVSLAIWTFGALDFDHLNFILI